MTESNHSRRSVIAATSLATIVYVVSLTPFDVVKNTQIASRTTLNARTALLQLYRQSGVKTLWRGVQPSLVSVSLNNFVYYPLYEELKPRFTDYAGNLGYGLAGALSRSCSVIVASPAERLRTAVQANGRSSSFSVNSFKGLRATIYRDILYSSTLFFLMESLNQQLEHLEPWKRRAISVLAGGTAAVFVTHPFDVMKTKLQARHCCYSDYERRVFRGLIEVAKSEGLPELRKGILTRLSKLVPGFYIYISVYETVKALVP